MKWDFDRVTALLRRLYQRFNARDVDAVLAELTPEVMWANAMEGGYAHGHAELREYWTRQWAMFDPRVEPRSFTELPDGGVRVEVHQIVRDLEGKLLADGVVGHVFQFQDGRVSRFDVESGWSHGAQ